MKEAQIHAMMDAAVDGDYIWEVLKKARSERHIAIKWNFLLGDEYKDGTSCNLACIKEASFTIL